MIITACVYLAVGWVIAYLATEPGDRAWFVVVMLSWLQLLLMFAICMAVVTTFSSVRSIITKLR